MEGFCTMEGLWKSMEVYGKVMEGLWKVNGRVMEGLRKVNGSFLPKSESCVATPPCPPKVTFCDDRPFPKIYDEHVSNLETGAVYVL